MLLVWRGMHDEAAGSDMPAVARTAILKGLQGEQAELLRHVRDMLTDVMVRPREAGPGGGERGMLLVALAGCVEGVVAGAPLKVTADSGVVGRLRALLAEEMDGDAVHVAVVDAAAAVLARKERVELPSVEADVLWALMGSLVEATRACLQQPGSGRLPLTKRLATATVCGLAPEPVPVSATSTSNV